MAEKSTFFTWPGRSQATRSRWFIGAALTFGVAPIALAQAKITGVTTAVAGGNLVITVAGNDLKTPKEMRVMRDTIYIAEFESALAGGVRPAKMNVQKMGVESVQFGWYTARPPKVRVSVRLTDSGVTPLISKSADGFKIVVPTQANAGADTNSLLPNPAETRTAPTKGDSTPILTPGPNNGAPDFMSLRRPEDPPVVVKQTPPVQPKVRKDDGNTPMRPNGFEKEVRSNTVTKKMVSLDFVATDVNLVLKALAIQSGYNIVTAPNMAGAVTVSIANVPVESALDYVTVPSGLRWERVRGSTYVVAPKDKIREIVNELSRRDQTVSTTLIVPIYSGDIMQIRETVTRAFVPSTADGSFEMLLSSEITTEKKEESSSSGGSKATPEGGGKVDPGQAGGQESSSKSEKSAIGSGPLDNLYMILIGNEEMVEKVREYIVKLDKQICNSYGIEPSVSSALFTDTYTIRSKTLKAKDMIGNVAFTGAGPAFPKVALHASPETGERQSVIIVGRESEVLRAKSLLAEFDGVGDNIAVYDVKYSDPRTVRDHVISYVPGLQVDFAPGGAGAPRLYDNARLSNKNTNEMRGGGSGGGGGTGTGTTQDSTTKGESKDFDSALSQPFNALERTAQPMRLILRGTPEQIARAAAFIEQIDLEPKQVAIDVRVVELSRSEAMKIGIDWSMLTGGIARSVRINQNPGRTASDIGTLEGETRINYNLNGQTGDIFSALDQLEGSGKVISRPNLLAMDGRESETFIGETIRYVESIQSTQNGVTVTTAAIGVGIRLAVIPRIGAEGKITLDMRPVIRSLKGFTSVPGGGQLPQTVERVMTNTVMVNSGETIALGGLITDTESRTMGGIPILKDIPIIGRLFSRETKNRDRRELVFFITVKEINTENRGRAAAPRDAERNNGLVEEQTNPKKVEKKKG